MVALQTGTQVPKSCTGLIEVLASFNASQNARFDGVDIVFKLPGEVAGILSVLKSWQLMSELLNKGYTCEMR
jgi:hypothetical protein